MEPSASPSSTLTRRRLLGAGLGALTLAGLSGGARLGADEPAADANPLRPRAGHFAAKARAVIWLYMEGGPSGFDLFDPKPELTKRHGQRLEGIQTHFGHPGPLMRSPFGFAQHGQAGHWICDRYPTLAGCADDLALIKSVWTESPNHAPAMYQMNTGIARPGFPSAGSWITYGLGSPNQDFPGYVVLGGSVMKGGALNWGAGFLPAAFQGTLLRTQGQPILDLALPGGVTAARQGELLDLAARLNAGHLQRHPGEADLPGRGASFALASRMQRAAPEITGLAAEDAGTRALYGLDRDGGTRAFGEKCLLARRMVERGVRFVQVYSNDEWDAHGDLAGNHGDRCRETDVPIAGLIADLKRRGLFDSTLIVWGGEFGRMPVSEGGKGRDHNPQGFLMWMAGAGIKGGASHGETDELGLKATVDPVSVHDVHATVLHLLGIDHKRLTFAHNGRDYRLTDTAGEPIRGILA
jgi:hypothetical protein